MTTNLPNGGGYQQQQQQHQQRPRNRPYQYPSSSSSSASLKGCCCCLFLLLIFLALLVVAVGLVIALVVKPKKPQLDLNQVGVTYLLVSSASAAAAAEAPPAAGGAYLSLNITLLFTAENPNKVGLRYGASQFYVMYHGVPLGVATVPAFEQPAHSTRLVQTRLTVSRFDVMQADALDLIRDASVNDRVDLKITGDVDARIKVLGFTSPKVQVAVVCAIVISPRKQSLTYKQCGVDGWSV
ncbi:uncharacterized protein M6B38_161910 [Iris pallida]|uniref:Late embryogenesis abundant protein LEA-2 subgroup domain-containing protein n=1 Tax=Iris pallida TaxID=29817 RepID=A0AAX6EZF0_IRIPA|nr:uncharacterized protein M6B38_161910 [Iris pallida]